MGVPAAAAGVVVVLPKAWDVLFNPVVGLWSDREAGRTGHRTRLLVVGTCTLPVAFAVMFASPADGTAGLLWVLGAYLLAATAFAFFQVPYVSLPTEMSPDAAERTRVMSWRIVALTLGILLGGGLAPLLITAGGGGHPGHVLMGVVMGAVAFVALLVATRSTRWVPSRGGQQQLGLRATLTQARGNRAFVLLAACYVPQVLGIAMMQAAVAYVATYRLDDYGLTSLLFVALVAPGIVAVPLWARLAGRIGKVRCYRLCTAGLAMVCLALLPAVLSGEVAVVLGLVLLMGVAFGGQQMLPFALLPDTILVDAERTGQQQAGVFSGAFAALETAAFAVGPGVFALVLALTGFASSTFDEPVQQGGAALNGIAIGFSLVPAVLIAATLPLIGRYARTEAARQGEVT